MKFSAEYYQGQVDSLEEAIAEQRDKIARAERDIAELGLMLDQATGDLLKAQAAADSDAYPVGTRVRHHVFKDLTGTIAASDGTGLAVRQDASYDGAISYGFTAREWVAI